MLRTTREGGVSQPLMHVFTCSTNAYQVSTMGQVFMGDWRFNDKQAGELPVFLEFTVWLGDWWKSRLQAPYKALEGSALKWI